MGTLTQTEVQDGFLEEVTSQRHKKEEEEGGRQKEERRVLNREDRVGTGRGGRQLGKFKDCKG